MNRWWRRLTRLKLAPVPGYRGKPAADIDKLIDAVLAVQACVDAFRQQDDGQAAIIEIEINPLILTPTRAVAVDALIGKETVQMSEPVKTKITGHVLEVMIDRPKANAIDLSTSRIMGEIFREFRDNPQLRVAILGAAGDKFDFSLRAGI